TLVGPYAAHHPPLSEICPPCPCPAAANQRDDRIPPAIRWPSWRNPLRAILVGGLLAVGMFGLAKAGQLEDGEATYFKHDYAKAVRLLRPLADKGNAPAQNRLASIYFWGGH